MSDNHPFAARPDQAGDHPRRARARTASAWRHGTDCTPETDAILLRYVDGEATVEETARRMIEVTLPLKAGPG